MGSSSKNEKAQFVFDRVTKPIELKIQNKEGCPGADGKWIISFSTKKIEQGARCTKPHLGSITFTNTYINILHITATQRGSRRVTQRMAGWLQFSPQRCLAEQLLFLIIQRMGSSFYFLFSLFFCFLLFFLLPPLLSLSPPSPVSDLVCPVWRSAIGGFGSLRLLLHGAGLVALARSTLEKGNKGERSINCHSISVPRKTSSLQHRQGQPWHPAVQQCSPLNRSVSALHYLPRVQAKQPWTHQAGARGCTIPLPPKNNRLKYKVTEEQGQAHQRNFPKVSWGGAPDKDVTHLECKIVFYYWTLRLNTVFFREYLVLGK